MNCDWPGRNVISERELLVRFGRMPAWEEMLGVDLALAAEAPIAWPESLAADEPFCRFNLLSPFRGSQMLC